MGKHSQASWLAFRKRKVSSKGRFPPYHGPPGSVDTAPVEEDDPDEAADPAAVPDGLFEEPPRRFEGVSRDKESGKWLSGISIGGNRVQLGRYDSFDDAVEARRRAEVEFGLTPPQV